MIDLFLHAGTKFALEQWLDARGLGDSFQDVDAESPTFGDWFYTHTDPNSTFIWWRHPSGRLESTAPVFDVDDNVTTPGTDFTGFYGILRFRTFDDLDSQIGAWVRTSTAVSVLESFAGYGGEGITIIAPEDVQAHLDAEGIPGHEFLGGMQWTDPRVWFLGPVMEGDERIFDGATYRSLVDFNVWTPTQAPQTWELVDNGEPDPPGDPVWTASGATFEGVVGGGVISVSDTSVFSFPESIRIGSIEITANSVFTPGAPGVILVSETSTDLQFNTPNGTIIEVLR